MSNGLKPEEIGSYNFGDTTAAPEFDPDNQGRGELCPGVHRFRVAAFDRDGKYPPYELYSGQQAKWNGQPCVVNKLLARFRCVEGAARNAITSDFIPVPAAGYPLPAGMQNQWGQFVKSLGFNLPKGQLLPTEMLVEAAAGRDPFALLVDRECMIKIIHQRGTDKQPKYNDDGTPQYGPEFFGYSPVGSVPVFAAPRPPNSRARPHVNAAGPATIAQPAGTASNAYAPPVTAGTIADIDL